VPPPHSAPLSRQGKIRKNTAVLVYIYISHNTFSIRSISDISLLKEFVDHPNSEICFGQLFATGRKHIGKKLEIFTKKMLKYLEKSIDLPNHKTGGNKNTTPKP
jgi:hypothetical protein